MLNHIWVRYDNSVILHRQPIWNKINKKVELDGVLVIVYTWSEAWVHLVLKSIIASKKYNILADDVR
jgi:hypothetical protein